MKQILSACLIRCAASSSFSIYILTLHKGQKSPKEPVGTSKAKPSTADTKNKTDIETETAEIYTEFAAGTSTLSLERTQAKEIVGLATPGNETSPALAVECDTESPCQTLLEEKSYPVFKTGDQIRRFSVHPSTHHHDTDRSQQHHRTPSTTSTSPATTRTILPRASPPEVPGTGSRPTSSPRSSKSTAMKVPTPLASPTTRSRRMSRRMRALSSREKESAGTRSRGNVFLFLFSSAGCDRRQGGM